MKLISSLTLAVLTALPSLAQHATREDFKEFCQVVSGRWVSDHVLGTDWPGIGKRGDRVACYVDRSLGEDGHVLVIRFFLGAGSGTEVIVYDAAAKRIRAYGGDSGGTTWDFILYKKNGTWTSQGTNSLMDGTKNEALYTLTASDNGNTHRWAGSTKVSGKAPDPVNNVFRRVSK